MELIKYILSSPWVFIGAIILIYASGEVIGTIVNNILETVIICKVKNTKEDSKCGKNINRFSNGVHVEHTQIPFPGPPGKQPKRE